MFLKDDEMMQSLFEYVFTVLRKDPEAFTEQFMCSDFRRDMENGQLLSTLCDDPSELWRQYQKYQKVKVCLLAIQV